MVENLTQVAMFDGCVALLCVCSMNQLGNLRTNLTGFYQVVVFNSA